jgi:N-acetylated-alpha-linked acidic dipeptidase
MEELDGSEAMPGIPALPVSARDGETILKAMGGDVAPPKWQGGEGAPVYRLGPGPAVLNLTYIVSASVASNHYLSVVLSELKDEFIDY